MAGAVLRIPDEKMRDKVASTIDAYVSSLRRELGHPVPPRTVRAALVSSLETELGRRLVAGELRDDERIAHSAWVRKMRDRAWVDDLKLENSKLKPLRLTGHVRVGHGTNKAPGGLVRVTLVIASGEVIESLVSGDFYAIGDAPARIEEALLGDAGGDSIGRRLESAWAKLEAPGVTAADVTAAARQAAGATEPVPAL